MRRRSTEVRVQVKAIVLQPFQHDRFYRVGEAVTLPKIVFDDLLPRGLVAEEAKAEPEAARKPKSRVKANG
jgi:hypothetical protein